MTKHTIKIDTLKKLVIQPIGNLVQITGTFSGITVFMEFITGAAAVEIAEGIERCSESGTPKPVKIGLDRYIDISRGQGSSIVVVLRDPTYLVPTTLEAATAGMLAFALAHCAGELVQERRAA